MLSVCRYDKKADIAQVDQFGFVDLVKSVSEGFVPNDLTIVADSFDGEEIDPESIIGKPSDRFDAMRMQDSLAEGIRKENKIEVKKSDSYDKSEKL